MLLGEQDIREILLEVVSRGGDMFLDNLFVEKSRTKDSNLECPVCHNVLKKNRDGWIIVNSISEPMFEDAFDTEPCAKRGIEWLKLMHETYLNYLGGGGVKSEFELKNEDKLETFLMQKDGESRRQHRERIRAYIKS